MIVVPFVLAVALTAPAAPKGKWVVLVRTEGDVPSAWREVLQKAAEESKLRTWTPPPAVTLEDARLALGCPEWNGACAGQVAQMTGAAAAYLVNLKPTGAGVLLSAEGVLASGAPAKGRTEITLPDASEDSLKFAAVWVKGALADKLPALLIVETATPGATVSLDGKRAGTTERGPVRIIVENPGSHTLLVTQAGSAPVTREIKIEANATQKETVALAAEAPPVDIGPKVGNPDIIAPPPPPPPLPPPTADSTGAVVGWSLTGVGAVIATGAGVAASALTYDMYFAAVPGDCGDERCIPIEMHPLFGLLDYSRAERFTFFQNDGPAMLTIATVTTVAGALLAGTGVWLSLSAEPMETVGE